MFSPDLYEFVKLLIENQVEYLVVGGYAVGIHGHPRYTGDLDIWINPTSTNAPKVLKSVNEFGFSFLSELATSFIPNDLLRSLVVDGILSGVGGVIVFLPQILSLYRL